MLLLLCVNLYTSHDSTLAAMTVNKKATTNLHHVGKISTISRKENIKVSPAMCDKIQLYCDAQDITKKEGKILLNQKEDRDAQDNMKKERKILCKLELPNLDAHKNTKRERNILQQRLSEPIRNEIIMT